MEKPYEFEMFCKANNINVREAKIRFPYKFCDNNCSDCIQIQCEYNCNPEFSQNQDKCKNCDYWCSRKQANFEQDCLCMQKDGCLKCKDLKCKSHPKFTY